MVEIQITLSDWLYEAVIGTEVLTISKDYFRLRKALERRIYDIARKHCGNQPQWKIRLEALRIKTGSGSSIREFRRMINKIIKDNLEKDYFPEYIPSLEISNKEEFIVFLNRKQNVRINSPNISTDLLPLINSEYITEEKALEYSKIYTDLEIKEIIFAANCYIEDLKKDNKTIKSHSAIIKKAFSEKWIIPEVKEDNELVLDQHLEDSLQNETWKKVRESFCKKYGIGLFNSWIKDLEAIEINNNKVILEAKTKFIADYITNNYLHDLEKLFSVYGNSNLRITICNS